VGASADFVVRSGLRRERCGGARAPGNAGKHLVRRVDDERRGPRRAHALAEAEASEEVGCSAGTPSIARRGRGPQLARARGAALRADAQASSYRP
jgi:hypothetical protein